MAPLFSCFLASPPCSSSSSSIPLVYSSSTSFRNTRMSCFSPAPFVSLLLSSSASATAGASAVAASPCSSAAFRPSCSAPPLRTFPPRPASLGHALLPPSHLPPSLPLRPSSNTGPPRLASPALPPPGTREHGESHGEVLHALTTLRQVLTSMQADPRRQAGCLRKELSEVSFVCLLYIRMCRCGILIKKWLFRMRVFIHAFPDIQVEKARSESNFFLQRSWGKLRIS